MLRFWFLLFSFLHFVGDEVFLFDMAKAKSVLDEVTKLAWLNILLAAGVFCKTPILM